MSQKPAALVTLASLVLACSPADPQDADTGTGQPGATDDDPSTGAAPTGTGDGPLTTGTTAATTPAPTTTADTTTADTSSDATTTGTTGGATDDVTGTSDGTSTGAALGCADLPLCEDFEGAAVGGPPDPALWTVSSPNCMGAGTLAIATDQAHGGARSLRVDGGGGYCDHVFIAHSAALPGLGPQVYGRFFVRFESALGDGHVTFLTLRDANDANGKDLRMGGQSKIFMWNRESDDATLPSLSPTGIAQSLAPAPQQWTCVEFMIDQATARLTTWVDGAQVPGLLIDGEPTPDVDQQWLNKPDWQPTLQDIKFGWESYAGQAMIVHFDDIALAAAPIGC